jgi:predicted lactoylglutathione lyase
MTYIESVTLEVADVAAARAFYAEAFGLGPQLRLRASTDPTAGFRGFSLSLVVSQPANVNSYVETALAAGATVLKPAAKSFWGYGGVVQAPDGTIWKLASSAKKDSAPPTRRVDDVVLLLGVADVKASKKFYVEHGLTLGRSFGGKYAELDSGERVKLSLYPRRANAKDAGVEEAGSGSHRLAIVGDLGTLTDPDGYSWEAA